MAYYMLIDMSQNVADSEETKVVQTEVPARLHEQFTQAARKQDMTLKEAAAEAIAAFTYRHQPVDSDDPLFAPLEWDDDVERDDDASERVDDIAYGAPDTDEE